MNESPNNLSETLLAAGYTREERGRDVVWSLLSDPDDRPIRAKIEVLERKSQFHLHKCSVQIDLNILAERLIASAKKRFLRVTSASFTVESDGRIRLVLEIAPPRTPAEPPGAMAHDPHRIGTVVGWTVSLDTADQALSVQITDVFYLGDHIEHWFADITTSTTEAVAPGRDKSWDLRHLREMLLPIPALPVRQPDSSRKIGRLGLKPMSEIEIPNPLRTSVSGTKKIIETSHEKINVHNTIPIEILEARETSMHWQSLDERISKRRVKNTSPSTPLNSDLLTRIAAVPKMARPDDISYIDGLLTQTFDLPLIAMTGASAIARESDERKKTLEVTALLIRGICKRYGSINELQPLQRLVPEYLGDCWSNVDSKMAYKSWNASLTAGGNFQRVQFKIAQLAEQKSETATEFRALIALASRERRRNIAGMITSRILQLLTKHPEIQEQSDEDVDAALLQLSATCPENAALTLTISSRQRAKGNTHTALAILEQRLSDNRHDISGHDRAKLNALMADIWHNDEHKPILAAQRYMIATTSPSEPDDLVLTAAETFFTKTGNPEQTQRITRLRIKETITSGGLDALERSAGYFADHSMMSEAAADVTNLIVHGRVRQWYLDVIENSDAIDLNQQEQLANAMLQAELHDLPTDAASNWKLNAARIGIKFDSTRQQSIKILENPAITNRLDEAHARFFYDSVIKIARMDIAADIIKIRLTLAKPGKNGDLHEQIIEQIIEQIMKHKLQSDDGFFENAIAEYCARKGDISPLIHRAHSFIASQSANRLEILCKCTASSLAGSQHLIQFLDQLIEMLAVRSTQFFVKPLEAAIFERRAIGDLTQNERQSLFLTLFKGEHLDLATSVLSDAVDQGELCCDDELIVTNLLSAAPQTLAKWLMLYSRKITEESERTRLIKDSVTLWLKTDERPRDLLDGLHELALNCPMSDSDMALVEQLVKAHQELRLFPTLIARQLTLQPPKNAQGLIQWALRFIMANVGDTDLAAKMFSQWSLVYPSNRLEDAYTNAYFQIIGQQITEAQKNLTRALSDPEVLAEESLLPATLELLVRTKIDRGQLAVLLQTLLVWAKTSGNETLTQQLKNLGIEWNISGYDELQTEFINTFTSNSVEHLAKIAVQILTKAERLPGGAQKIIGDWMTSQVIALRQDKWWQLVGLLTTDKYLGKLKRSARCDVLFAYAMSLFDDDARRIDSIVHLEAIAHENPLDARTWIPLYSLYEETGARQKLIQHLDRVIPLIQNDKSILDQTPFNLESLRNSLRRARNQEMMQSSAPQKEPASIPISGQKNKEDLEFMRIRAAEMQNEWLAALPQIQIKAISSHPSPEHHSPDQNPLKLQFHFEPESEANAPKNVNFEMTKSQAIAVGIIDPESSQKFFDGYPTKTEEHPANDPPKPTGHPSAQPLVASQLDWRKFAIDLTAPAGSTERIMSMAFASEMEKHLAIQSTALVTGETGILESWHWPVWRRVERFDYSLSPASRLHEDLNLRHYHGALHKLLRVLTPVLLNKYRHHRDIGSKLSQIGASRDANSVEVHAEHPALSRGVLRFFQSFSQDLKIRYFDTRGLGAEVFFDVRHHAMHFDAVWQMNFPPGVLTYRVLECLNHIQRGNVSLTAFDPVTEVMPILDELRAMLTATGLSRVRVAFGMEHRELSEFISRMNRQEVVDLLSQISRINALDIKQLQTEIRLKSLATILASTLDLIGMAESICGRDLCAPGGINGTLLNESQPLVKELLRIVTRLNI